MRIYACIDLKTFYASVECVERRLDPLTTNLVVADDSRTEKTICLAVTQSLKSYGISGRARLFEVIQQVKNINQQRKKKIQKFTKKSYNNLELINDDVELDYIIAPPRMALYIEYSAKIYNIYLKYVAKEDIHVYSIDEVFMDITNYLKITKQTPEQFIRKIIKDVLETTGITATAGIGTNMYLAKVAMDIVAKKMQPDKNGVRIATLDEISYRKELWNHQPLTDFWRIGNGYNRRLQDCGLKTMGDIAKFSIKNEDLLYDIFGINAELLIDHAWGFENCRMTDIKNYKSLSKSIGIGQVLHCPYDFKKTTIILKEMLDNLSSDLVSKNYMVKQIVVTIGYDVENLKIPEIANNYQGEIVYDFYGRPIPKHDHFTVNLSQYTFSSKTIINETLKIFNEVVNQNLLVRRLNVACGKIRNILPTTSYQQMSFFNMNEQIDNPKDLEKEFQLQKSILNIKNKYGKNAILKGINLEEGATTKERNNQIGGHKA